MTGVDRSVAHFLMEELIVLGVQLKELQAENEKLKIDPGLRREIEAAQATNRNMAHQLSASVRARETLQADLDTAEADKAALRREIDRLLSGEKTRYDEEIEACKAERNAYSCRVDGLDKIILKLCHAARAVLRDNSKRRRTGRALVLERDLVDAISDAGH